jgi:hypothetical protein
MPEAFWQLQATLLKRPGSEREMIEILALVLQHDEQAVLCAIELAREPGVPAPGAQGQCRALRHIAR